MKIISTLTIVILLCRVVSHAQTVNQQDTLQLTDLSFEELMNVRIVSASKKDETLFNAPVTSFVISRKEIVNSGVTSIPEALRLAPALIVREMANGSYDVSIRGGKDNLASHRFWNTNTTILAMIDNQVIYNYYSGGTYWQNLPVDLADVERIEIVYGPNAPLYGPNAVDGVINIITRRWSEGDEVYGSASIQAGESLVFSALGGKKVSDKFEVNVSANHSSRKRMKVEYYDPATSTFITDLLQHSDPIVAADPNAYFPDHEIATRRTGLNLNLYIKPKKDLIIGFNSGYNESLALIGSTISTNFQKMRNSSLMNRVKAEIGHFAVQTSVIRGTMGLMGNLSEYNFDYMTWDNYVDYNLKINSRLSFRPSFSYQQATIDDQPYTTAVGGSGKFNDKAIMYNYAYSLKGDYTPAKSLRIIGAIRADKFKAPDDTYISYQGIVNYKINNDHIFRFLVARAYEGSFIEPTYLNLITVDDPFMLLTIHGNQQRELLQNNLSEIGYKTRLGKNMSFDVSVFHQVYNDFSTLVTKNIKEPVFFPEPEQGTWIATQQNIDLVSKQTGITLAATIMVGKASFKPSVTFQKTMMEGYTPYYYEPHPVIYPERNLDMVTDKESKYAPEVFGGFALNTPFNKWNINFSGYYYSKYKLDGLNSLDHEKGEIVPQAIDNIHGKLLLNANIAYAFSKQVNAFVNVRNILGDDSREAYGTDRIGRLLFAGLHIDL